MGTKNYLNTKFSEGEVFDLAADAIATLHTATKIMTELDELTMLCAVFA